jgi:hypothetical protein
MDLIEQLVAEAGRRTDNDGSFVEAGNDDVVDEQPNDIVAAASTIHPVIGDDAGGVAAAEKETVISPEKTTDDASVAAVIPSCPPHPAVVLRCALIKKQKASDDDLFESALAFLSYHSLYTKNCPYLNQKQGSVMECRCFSVFSESQHGSSAPLLNAVARFVVYFVKLCKATQQRYVIEWIRYGKLVDEHRKRDWRVQRQCKFLLPLISLPDDSKSVRKSTVLVCRSCIQIIIGKGRKWWDTCSHAVRNNIIPQSGNIGRSTNFVLRDKDAVIEDLHVYFKYVLSMCDVIPTRFVRERTGLLTTRDNNDYYTLPPYWSKRNLYS